MFHVKNDLWTGETRNEERSINKCHKPLYGEDKTKWSNNQMTEAIVEMWRKSMLILVKCYKCFQDIILFLLAQTSGKTYRTYQSWHTSKCKVLLCVTIPVNMIHLVHIECALIYEVFTFSVPHLTYFCCLFRGFLGNNWPKPLIWSK